MTPSFITLNAAVTWLAFGKQRTPNEELELRRSDQHKIVKLIDVCLDEARKSTRYASFPRHLPFWPLSALVDCLDHHRGRRPPSAEKLRDLAARQLAKWQRYDAQYDQALGQIVEAARAGKLELYGEASQEAGAKVGAIPAVGLLGHVTIDHQRANLGPDVTASDRPRPFAILRSRPGLQPIFYNVATRQEQFRKVFRNALAGTDKAPRKNIEKRIEAWYRTEWIPANAGRIHVPREEDLAAAQQKFDAVTKIRPLMRHLRKQYAPAAWSGRGRRRQNPT
jgi:hypothetical protein